MLSIVGSLLLVGTPGGGAAAEGKPTLKWFTLAGCQFLPSAHRDADRFHIRTSDRREFSFRLYFTEAPATDLASRARLQEQASYFGVTEEELIKGGEAARKFAAALLARGCTVTTRWQNAQGDGRLPGYYAQIQVDGSDLGEQLVSSGWARVKGTVAILADGRPAKEHLAKLQKLEAEAKSKHLGLWANAGK